VITVGTKDLGFRVLFYEQELYDEVACESWDLDLKT